MLDGARVLVVEDDPLVAETLSDLIEASGGKVVGPMVSMSEVTRNMPTLWADVAILDLNVTDGEITPVLERLIARHVPVVVYTGADLPPEVRLRHPDLVSLRKPVQPARLVGEIRKAMRAAAA
jgi:DNA-binding NtrC family response regulator